MLDYPLRLSLNFKNLKCGVCFRFIRVSGHKDILYRFETKGTEVDANNLPLSGKKEGAMLRRLQQTEQKINKSLVI